MSELIDELEDFHSFMSPTEDEMSDDEAYQYWCNNKNWLEQVLLDRQDDQIYVNKLEYPRIVTGKL